MLRVVIFIMFVLLQLNAKEKVVISVLANFGEAQALKSWQPTIDYLQKKLPQYQFNLLPVSFFNLSGLKKLIAEKKVDYFIVNPAVYVDLELSSGVSRILTIVKKENVSQFGSVIITSAKTSIRTIEEIPGHTIAGINRMGFGGWLIGYDEILKHGIDAYKQCPKVSFLSTQNNILKAIVNGNVDVGIIRTGVIEDFIKRKLLKRSDIRVINQYDNNKFPFIRSTRLYPEWAFAEAPHITHNISKDIAAVLLSLPLGSNVAKSADYSEWTTPYDYQPVHRLMKNLHVGPYVNYGKLTLSSLLKRYTIEITSIIFLLLIILSLFLFTIYKKNLRLLKETKQKEKAYRKIELMIHHDSLTELPNRAYIYLHSNEWIHEGADPFSIIFLDLDNFKYINDSFGHRYGDEILKQVALRLQNHTQGKGIVARQGGDEFILMIQSVEEEFMTNFTSELISIIAKPYKIENKEFTVGASAGVASYPQHAQSFDQLLSIVDIAMYEAKKRKNSYFIYSDELNISYHKKVEIEQELRTALAKNELFLVYQPQIGSSGNLHGVETLLRWNSPKLGMIPPDQFISVAEDTGLISDIGHFIIKQALADMQELQESVGKKIQLSINISVKQLIEIDFLDYLKADIQKYGIEPQQLTLEITESLFIEDIDYVLPLLEKISSEGIVLSLDDFGTGYSSLSMLRRLPISELKIDKSFVDEIISNKHDRALIKAIIKMGKEQGMSIVAEGTETKEQIDILKSFGCDIFQGYFYAKPMKKDEFFNQLFMEVCI